ncbi:2-isopropylmalate synthase [Marinobacter sp. M216]|uniref:2-isopropylmalate synthase n=1 Tax=Marinobacter albus TaxID=3030833 RepID=A0ABT7HGK7_9GAMM|nr:2-isopropylmalate synthase [Marinobacter sp. M216]MDK9559488.1 2-isopropylmalate synthase [Marinobacter sp. M216]
MMQSETERQFYLGMAGVRLWYARSALPGAAPSPDYIFDDEQGSEADQLEVPVPSAPVRPVRGGASPPGDRQETGGARVANLQALIDDAGSPSGRPGRADGSQGDKVLPEESEPGSAEKDVAPVISGGLTPELNLQLWIGRDVSMIARLSAEASLRLQETLAENILKSLGETQLRRVGPVRWPVFNNLRAPGNSMADLRSVLDHALSTLQGQKVVVLGLPGPEGYDGDESWLQYISGTRPDLNFAGTLAELASDPAQKRALWQQLKSLAGQ